MLKAEVMIGDDPGVLYFRGWAGKKSKHPEFSDKLRFAKHWKDKTNCKRFLNRNIDHLEKYKLIIDRVIRKRNCEYCGVILEKEARTQSRFCSDLCRVKDFKAKNP